MGLPYGTGKQILLPDSANLCMILEAFCLSLSRLHPPLNSSRWFIDPNRDITDIDPAMLDPTFPLPDALVLNPGPKSHLGIGLIRR